MSTSQLVNKLRPRRLEDVVGQPGAVAYVRGMMRDGAQPNLLLISGPSGTGKTTLGRIIGTLLSGYRGDPSTDPDVREVPANVDRSIDDVRGLITFSQYRPQGGKRRVIVVDEAHSYVGPAASAMLKATEDPPKHVTWIFCTDQPGKLPKAQRDRAQGIALKPVEERDIVTALQRVADSEKMPGSVTDKVLARIASMSQNTPRLAVQMLETLHRTMRGGGTLQQALDQAADSNPAVEAFEAAKNYLACVLAGDTKGAVTAVGGTGDGVLEVSMGMMSGLVRHAAGGNPSTGLGWAAVKQVRHKGTLDDLVALEARLVAAMVARTSSNYAVPADAVLFALSRRSG